MMTIEEVIDDIELRAHDLGIEQEPEEMVELRERIMKLAENANALRILFGVPDQSAVQEVVYLKRQYDHLHDQRREQHQKRTLH